MHILVTGGAGFIGSHIVDGCLARGWRVTVVDDLSTGLRENVNPAARFVEGDLADPATLDILFADPVDVVNHHAAQIDVRTSVADPAYDAERNIVASLRLFSRAVAAGTRKIIFASSGGAAYGEPQFAPQGENHPFAPLSPYGIAKLSVEYYLSFFANVHGVSTTALRYGNVYGPRQRVDGEAGVIAIFCGRMLSGEEVVINGDGSQTRDYVFVGDVARANVAAIERDLTGAYNVGTGREISVTELAAALAHALGTPLRVRNAPPKAGEQKRSVLDASRLRADGGVEPIPLEEGLQTTVDWFRSRH